MASCEVLIAVIGRGWLEVKDDNGHRRLDNPRDFVRLEIAAALKRGVPVIPALVGGAKMPGPSNLPSPLSNLTRRQAIEISHTRFHSDVDRLIGGLERILPPEQKEALTPTSRPGLEELEAASNRTIVEPSPSHPTIKIPEGVYLDLVTNLMWINEDNGFDITWDGAIECAKQSRLGGYSDWRLPTIYELETLYDPKADGEYKIRKPFKLTGPHVWSSTKEGSVHAWSFDFLIGRRARSMYVGIYLDIHEARRALFVRRT